MVISILSAHFFLFLKAMPDQEFILMTGCGTAFVLIVGLIFILDFMKKRKRTQSLQTFAWKNNWTFEAKPKIENFYQFHNYSLFGSHKEKICNLLQKPAGQDLAFVFDYCYTPVDSDGEGVEQRLTVIAFRSPLLNIPFFRLYQYRPKFLFSVANFLKKRFKNALEQTDVDSKNPGLAEMFRFGIEQAENLEIKFDSHPQFSNRYWLRGKDKLGIRHIFQPQVLSYFESISDFAVEGGGNYLFIHIPGKIIESGELRARFQTAWEIYSLFRR
jgi:hypothetical protein